MGWYLWVAGWGHGTVGIYTLATISHYEDTIDPGDLSALGAFPPHLVETLTPYITTTIRNNFLK